MSTGLPVSVQVRLVRHAHELKIDPNLVLARYAAERLLYRLSHSRYADRFVLKGALMLLVWLGESIRSTRDADPLRVASSIQARATPLSPPRRYFASSIFFKLSKPPW
jgi:hypothetical protein